MAEKLTTAIDIKVGVSGDASVKSIKGQLREAVNEAANLAAKFGEASPEATRAAAKVAELRDRMEDLNNRVKALNPDKFQRFATFASGIASGFSAAQGAMALFGAETDDVQKQLAKVQGAMAFAQGLQGIEDLTESFSGLGNKIKTTVVGAFSSLRGAIAATGLGAFAVLIGTLISKLDDYGKEQIDAAKAANEHAFAMETLNVELDLANGLITQQEADLQKLNIERRKAIQAIKDEALQTALKDAASLLNADSLKDILLGETNPILIAVKRVNEAFDAAEKASADRVKRINEEYDKREEVVNAKARQSAKVQREVIKQAAKEVERDDELLNMQREENTINAAEKLTDLNLKIIEQRGELNRKLRKRQADEAAAEEAKRRADELAAEQAHAQAKLDLANSVAVGLGAIGDIVSAGTNRAVGIQKVAALAQIGIDTAVALTAALRNANAPTPDNVASGGLAGIAKYAGLAAQILSAAAKARAVLKSGSGQNITAASQGAFATVPEQGRTFTAFGLPSDRVEQAGGAGAMRVYVVDSDITRQQKRSRAIQRTSVI